MSDTYVVVSKRSADATDYVNASVFNNQHKDADNEEAANAYLAECVNARPWESHSVMTADEFKAFGEDAVSEDTDTAPAEH